MPSSLQLQLQFSASDALPASRAVGGTACSDSPVARRRGFADPWLVIVQAAGLPCLRGCYTLDGRYLLFRRFRGRMGLSAWYMYGVWDCWKR